MRTRALLARLSARSIAALALCAGACTPVTGVGDAGDAAASTCRSDRECSGGVCDRNSGRCVECLSAVDCLGAGQVCVRGACVVQVPCSTSRMCPGQVCDQTRGVCVDCVGDEDCPTDQQCRESYCAPRPRPCVSSRECSANAQVCDPSQGFCVDCLTAVDCAADEQCSANRCVRNAPPTPDAGPGMDVVSPPPDAAVTDVVAPPPDAPTPVDTVVPPSGPNEECPGASATSGATIPLDWSTVRSGADVGTSCGSRARSGRYRDVVYQFRTDRADNVRFQFGPLPVGAAYELQSACGTPVAGTCRLLTEPETGFGTGFGVRPAGTYRFVVEVPEGSAPLRSELSLEFATPLAPSPWSYAQSRPSGVTFADACSEPGVEMQAQNQDEGGASIVAPFPVQVYDFTAGNVGAGRSVFYLNVDGWFALGDTRGAPVRLPITDAMNPDGLVSILGADLVTTARGVCTATRGSAPNRRFVLQWDNARFASDSSSSVHMQVVVHEAAAGTPNTIDFVYDRLSGPSSGRVIGLRGSYLEGVTATSVTAPGAVRFTPMRR